MRDFHAFLAFSKINYWPSSPYLALDWEKVLFQWASTAPLRSICCNEIACNNQHVSFDYQLYCLWLNLHLNNCLKFI